MSQPSYAVGPHRRWQLPGTGGKRPPERSRPHDLERPLPHRSLRPIDFASVNFQTTTG